MIVALGLPTLLERLADRPVMIAGAVVMTAGTGLAAFASACASLLPLCFLLGAGYSSSLSPSGRPLRRSANPDDRPAIFTAQFAHSHASWLVTTYPMAGWTGARLGLPVAALPSPASR